MKIWKRISIGVTLAFASLVLVACGETETTEEAGTTEVELILDWVPNTNHTGIFVAESMGYFEEEGINLTVQRPPAGGGTELVGTGDAEFGIAFQDRIAIPFEQGLPVTAVATIIDHNTSGILSREETGIERASDMVGYSYGTWNEPIETALVEYIVEEDGGNFEAVELVPNQADNAVIGLANEMFDTAWIYYAWDGVMAEARNVSTNFFYLTDFADELDFYSPIIIANNDYLESNPEDVRAVLRAIKKGYQYTMENPEEAVDILIEHAPELAEQREFVLASQEWINEWYTDNPENWGYMDENRWNAFYDWLYENELVSVDLTETDRFTNEFLGD